MNELAELCALEGEWAALVQLDRVVPEEQLHQGPADV